MFFKLKIIIPLALLASGIATFGIYKYLDAQKKKLENQKPQVQTVVMAANDIQIGSRIESSNIKVSEWPIDIIPAGTFSDTSAVIGRVVKTDIFTGEAILESKLAPLGSEGGMASKIPPGMRALTVAVTTASGVSGFILVDAHVDVLVTVKSHREQQESSTKIILEDVKVLAVDQDWDREGDDPVLVQTVTLLVTPEQAEKLALGSTEGKLSLSLRNTADRSVQSTRGVKLQELVNRPAPRRTTRRTSTPTRRVTQPVEEQKKETIVEIIRSSEKTEVKFEEEKKNSTTKKK
jgi:pilus assembly protein CpaB